MGEPRSIGKPLVIACGLAAGLSVAVAAAQSSSTAATASSDWLTWGYDQERTLWNRAENVLDKNNVGQLALKWKTVHEASTETLLRKQTVSSP